MRATRVLATILALILALGVALAEGALPDGEYAPDGFTYSGGSGKVSITCPKITVAAGEVTATLVFSSPNYPRVVVDGAEYPAVHDGDTSIFEVPAPLNADFTVVGTTTAMSKPHDVAYTRHIYVGEAAPESQEAEGAAIEAAALEARDRDIPGLTWQGETPLRYAREFAVDRYEGGYRLLTLSDGGRYLVIPEGGEVPAGLDGDVRVLCRPLDRVYLAATASMALFDALDGLGAVRFSGTRAEGWYVENAAAAMERGEMLFAGKYSEPDYELLLGEAGERDEAVLYNWIYLTETEQKLQRRGSRYLLLGTLLCLAANAILGRWLTLPLAVAAVALPFVLALRGKFSLGSISLSSFAFCLAAITNELRGIRHRVLAQDWAGLGDTINVSLAICAVLALATLAANALLFAGRKK